MSLEDIESPPYPTEGTTAQGLYNHFKQLRKWILHYRNDINLAVGQEIIPALTDIPNKNAYLTQPVFTFYQHLMLLRHLREQWDHLIRSYEYEEDWTCTACIQARTMLIQCAAVLLNGAFTPFEVREARAQQHLEHMQRSFERLTAFFKKVMDPEEHDLHKKEDNE